MSSPADLVLVCGVFGNISDEDASGRSRRCRSCAARAAQELAFESAGPGGYAVGMHPSTRPHEPLQPGRRLLTFFR